MALYVVDGAWWKPVMELLRRHQAPSGAAPSPGSVDETDDAEDETVACARCGVVLARVKDLCAVDGASAHTRVNPAGIVFAFRTFSVVENTQPVGESSTEFSWFEGCAWRIIVCARCHVHLGWDFHGALRFTALLVERIR